MGRRHSRVFSRPGHKPGSGQPSPPTTDAYRCRISPSGPGLRQLTWQSPVLEQRQCIFELGAHAADERAHIRRLCNYASEPAPVVSGKREYQSSFIYTLHCRSALTDGVETNSTAPSSTSSLANLPSFQQSTPSRASRKQEKVHTAGASPSHVYMSAGTGRRKLQVGVSTAHPARVIMVSA